MSGRKRFRLCSTSMRRGFSPPSSRRATAMAGPMSSIPPQQRQINRNEAQLELIDNGVKWTVCVMRGAGISNNDLRFVGDKILPNLGDTGVADAWVTAKKVGFTFSGLGPLPEGRHLLQFMLLPHELCQLRRLPATNRISIACFPVTS